MQLPGLLSKVQRPGWQFLILLGWAHLQVVAEAAYLLTQSLRGRNPPSRFNYRIRDIANLSDGILSIFVILLLFALPAVLSWSAAANSSGISDAEHFILSANKWTFGTTSVVFIGYMVAYFWSRRLSEYPSTLFLKQNRPFSADVFSFGMDSLMIVLFISNLYFFIQLSLTSAQPSSDALATIPLVLVFIVIIIRTLLGSLTQQRSLEWLENLERDIVIHNITELEIRDRLEREYLGRELGALLKQRVDEARIRADALQRFTAEAEAKLEEISRLDANLVYERAGRIKDILTSLETKRDELRAQWFPLSKWLAKAIEAPMQDPYLRDLAIRTAKELGRETERGLDASGACVDKIKKVVAGL